MIYEELEEIRNNLVSIRLNGGAVVIQSFKELLREVSTAFFNETTYTLNLVEMYDWVEKLETAEGIEVVGISRMRVIEIFKEAYNAAVFNSGHPSEAVR